MPFEFIFKNYGLVPHCLIKCVLNTYINLFLKSVLHDVSTYLSGRRVHHVNNVDDDEQLAKALQESLNFQHRDPRRVSDYPSSYPPPPRYP